ncbi:MAG: SPOR domain-containing protein [Deltaproteobacteria bacterium]|nr:SPOR domain-containing protein [Deltaproteobacteria bacterium]
MAAKNRRMFELKLGKLGLILFIGGMSLLLFSMFFLGIVVGKHMEAYPERFSSGVAGLIRDRLSVSAPQTGKATPPAEAGKRDEPAGGEENFGLTFYDTLGGKKGGAAAGKTIGAVKDQPLEKSAPPPALTGKPAISEPSAGSAAGAVGNTSPPVAGRDGKKPNPLPERKPTADSGSGIPVAIPAGVPAGGEGISGEGRFEIQVSAYQDRRKAEQTIEKLKPLGFPSRVVMKDLPGKGRWFRVIVGGFENREKAKAAVDQIAGKIRGAQCVIRFAGNHDGG